MICGCTMSILGGLWSFIAIIIFEVIPWKTLATSLVIFCIAEDFDAAFALFNRAMKGIDPTSFFLLVSPYRLLPLWVKFRQHAAIIVDIIRRYSISVRVKFKAAEVDVGIPGGMNDDAKELDHIPLSIDPFYIALTITTLVLTGKYPILFYFSWIACLTQEYDFNYLVTSPVPSLPGPYGIEDQERDSLSMIVISSVVYQMILAGWRRCPGTTVILLAPVVRYDFTIDRLCRIVSEYLDRKTSSLWQDRQELLWLGSLVGILNCIDMHGAGAASALFPTLLDKAMGSLDRSDLLFLLAHVAVPVIIMYFVFPGEAPKMVQSDDGLSKLPDLVIHRLAEILAEEGQYGSLASLSSTNRWLRKVVVPTLWREIICGNKYDYVSRFEELALRGSDVLGYVR